MDLPAGSRDAGDYYEPYQVRAVLLLGSRESKIPVARPPLMLQEYGSCRRVLGEFTSDRSLAALRSALGDMARRSTDAILLHPYDAASVVPVVDNWLTALGRETWPFQGPHTEHIGLEVADNWQLFRGFLEPEMMLWQSLADLTGSGPTSHHRDALQEALEVGAALVSQIEDRIRAGRQTSALIVDTLCDLARRALIYEKRLTLQLLRPASPG